MNTLYLDAFSGLSGDMLVGALLDLGADFDALKASLACLALADYELEIWRKDVSGISALKFDVAVSAPQPERHLSEIRDLILGSAMPERTRGVACDIFLALARAEANVHRVDIEKVHFHEVGAVDSIIDIVACAWCLERLEIDEVWVSPLPFGGGLVSSRHGVIPAPAPATVELLAGFPLRLLDGATEMVTPTAAAVLRALAQPAPAHATFEIVRVGYGAGSRELTDRPNVLRAILGRRHGAEQTDELLELSTNIDDLNPQVYDLVRDRLFAAGARDVTLTPTIMKKGRPGVVLTVLADAQHRQALGDIIFDETSAIGLRFHRVARVKLEREIIAVETRWGMARVKVSRRAGGAVNLAPEFEDCRRLAEQHGIALKRVLHEVQAAAHRQVTHER